MKNFVADQNRICLSTPLLALKKTPLIRFGFSFESFSAAVLCSYWTMADSTSKLEKFASVTNDIALRLYRETALHQKSPDNVLLSPPALIISLYQDYLASENDPNVKREFEEAIFRQPLSSVQDIIKEYSNVLKNACGQSTDKDQPERHYDFAGGSRLFLSGKSSMNTVKMEEELKSWNRWNFTVLEQQGYFSRT